MEQTEIPYDEVMAGLGAMMAGAIVIVAIIFLIIYAIYVIPRAKLFKLAGYPGWKAWIPLYNIYTEAKIYGRNPWLILLLSIGLPMAAAIPFLGGFFWLLPVIFSMWITYELALVFGRSERFCLVFAILTGSSISTVFDWTTLSALVNGQDPADLISAMVGSNTKSLLGFIVLIMTYMLAFSSKTAYRGPWADKHARLLMKPPWLFIPPTDLPVPPYGGHQGVPVYQHANAGVQGSAAYPQSVTYAPQPQPTGYASQPMTPAPPQPTGPGAGTYDPVPPTQGAPFGTPTTPPPTPGPGGAHPSPAPAQAPPPIAPPSPPDTPPTGGPEGEPTLPDHPADEAHGEDDTSPED